MFSPDNHSYYSNDKKLTEMYIIQENDIRTTANSNNSTAIAAEGVLNNVFRNKYFRVPQKIGGNNARLGATSSSESPSGDSDATVYTIVSIPYYGILSLYPNPVSDETFIHFTIPDNCENAVLSVYNAIGEQIKTYQLDRSTGIIVMNVAYLKQGLYIVKLTDNKSFVDIRRMIIVK